MYCKGFKAAKLTLKTETLKKTDNLTQTISTEEVNTQIQNLESGKSPGDDLCTVEMNFKYLDMK